MKFGSVFKFYAAARQVWRKRQAVKIVKLRCRLNFAYFEIWSKFTVKFDDG